MARKPSMSLDDVSLRKDIRDLILYGIPIAIGVWYLFTYTGPEPRKKTPPPTTTQVESEKK